MHCAIALQSSSNHGWQSERAVWSTTKFPQRTLQSTATSGRHDFYQDHLSYELRPLYNVLQAVARRVFAMRHGACACGKTIAMQVLLLAAHIGPGPFLPPYTPRHSGASIVSNTSSGQVNNSVTLR